MVGRTIQQMIDGNDDNFKQQNIANFLENLPAEHSGVLKNILHMILVEKQVNLWTHSFPCFNPQYNGCLHTNK